MTSPLCIAGDGGTWPGVRDFLDGAYQRFFQLGGLRLHVDAQRVFRFFVREASPRAVDLREDNRPLILVRDHVQAIGSFGQRLSLHRHRIAEFDRGVFICARAPDFSEWNKSTPDLSPVHKRAVISDRDVSNSDRLRHGG